MKSSRQNTTWVLAIAVLPVLAGSAFGQVRASQDGRAADANNRVGSGGYNDSSAAYQNNVNPNQIIYGNVTGGKRFTGPINERDPGAFTGPIPGGSVDRFVSGSAAAPQPYQPAFDLSTPQPFYGSSRGVAPPVGTMRLGYSGSYLGTGLTPQTPAELSSSYNSALDYRAQTLGQSTLLGTRSTLLNVDQGELYMQGPLEAQNQNLIAGSPLYGVQSFQPGRANEASLYSVYAPSGLSAGQGNMPGSQSADILRMRQELQGAAQQGRLNNPAARQQLTPPAPGQQQQPGGTPQQPGEAPQNLGQPLEAPENTGFDASINPALNPAALNGGLSTGQGTRQRMTLIPPQLQSTQYGELQQRLKRYQNPQIAALQQNEDFLRQQRLSQARGPAAGGAPATRPVSGPMAAAMLRLPPAPPLKVTSLATGVKASGLHDLLSGAEDLMRHDKFQSAIEKYNVAEQVAPNNGLIRLGRANAELGAGYYRQASADLHNVFLADPALLMGQYDLKAVLPPQRIGFITKELQDLAKSDPKAEMPVFLLAYISYNTGEEAKAADYLKEAHQRAGNADPLLDQLETRWKASSGEKVSPETNPATDANPPDLNK